MLGLVLFFLVHEFFGNVLILLIEFDKVTWDAINDSPPELSHIKKILFLFQQLGDLCLEILLVSWIFRELARIEYLALLLNFFLNKYPLSHQVQKLIRTIDVLLDTSIHILLPCALFAVLNYFLLKRIAIVHNLLQICIRLLTLLVKFLVHRLDILISYGTILGMLCLPRHHERAREGWFVLAVD